VAKVYKGKKITKGIGHPTTISPSSHVTPFTPLVSEAEDAALTIKDGEIVKIQLGAQIDGFGAIVCDTIIVGKEKGDEVTGREADLLLATYYANELLLRCMLPTGVLREDGEKQPTQGKINAMLEKIAKSYEVKVVQNTTCWVFERNEIEGKKKIILAPTEGMKGEGGTDVGDVWGVEVGMSLGGGKVKDLEKRATLHRRTAITYGLKRPSSRQILSEIVKKFGTFPFSLRQLDDERTGKVGVVECVRANVLREYKPSADADGSPVSRLWTTIAITKNGITRLAAPPALDLDKVKSDKKITDEEILKILEKPLAKSTGAKSKNKKKKPKKKAPKKETAKESEEEEEDEDSSDDE
jgi:curved DNA binding protein